MATRLWTFLVTALNDGAAASGAHASGDAADTVLSIAALLTEKNPRVEQLAPLVCQIDSLLDAINAPLNKLVDSPLPLASMGSGLLNVYQSKTRTPPTDVQVMALLSQAAYLESLRDFVQRHPRVRQWLATKAGTPQDRTITLPLKALAHFELTEPEARWATLSFSRSALAGAFDAVLNARLEQLGAPPDIAQRMVSAVAKYADRHLKQAIAAVEDTAQGGDRP